MITTTRLGWVMAVSFFTNTTGMPWRHWLILLPWWFGAHVGSTHAVIATEKPERQFWELNDTVPSIPQFFGNVISIALLSAVNCAVLLYSEPNFMGNTTRIYESQYVHIQARSVKFVNYNKNGCFKFCKDYECNDVVAIHGVHEHEGNWHGTKITTVNYLDQVSEFSAQGVEIAIVFFALPFFQGNFTGFTNSAPLDELGLHFSSFKVLALEEMFQSFRNESNEESLLVHLTSESALFSGPSIFKFVQPGEEVASFGDLVVLMLDIPRGISVEAFRLPHFSGQPTIFDAGGNLDRGIVSSLRVAYEGQFQRKVVPQAVIFTERFYPSPALIIRAGESIPSVAFTRSSFNFFGCVDVPPGHALYLYDSPFFYGYPTRLSTGYYDRFDQNGIFSARSLILLREDQGAPQPKDGAAVSCMYAARTVYEIPQGSKYHTIDTLDYCHSFKIPQGLAVVGYEREWLQGRYFIWTSKNDDKEIGPVFGRQRLLSLHVVGEQVALGMPNSTLGPSTTLDVRHNFTWAFKYGDTVPALQVGRDIEWCINKYSDCIISADLASKVAVYDDCNFQGTPRVYDLDNPFNGSIHKSFKSYRVLNRSEPVTPFVAPFVGLYPIESVFNLSPIFLLVGEDIDEFIFPWAGNFFRVTVPQGLVVVTYNQVRFQGTCAAWTRDTNLTELSMSNVQSVRVLNASAFPGCPRGNATTLIPRTIVPPSNTPTIEAAEIPDTTDDRFKTSSPLTSVPRQEMNAGNLQQVEDENTANVSNSPGSSTKSPVPKAIQNGTNTTSIMKPSLNSSPSDDDTESDIEPSNLQIQMKKVGSVTTALFISVIALVMLFVIGIVLVLRRRKRKSVVSSNYDGLQLHKIDIFKLFVPPFPLTHVLGCGSTGSTYLGSFDGQQVAVKVLHQDPKPTKAQIQVFIDEIQLHGDLKSPYVVSLVGVVWTQPPDIQAIIEYMNLGDLRQYLANTTSHTFGWRDKITCLQNIAQALFYLHSQQMIHRDLKSRNVLLDKEKGAKLSDFGVAKQNVYADDTMTAAIGTYRWMAPEMLMYKGYTSAVDIYSLGVVVCELSTHELPYEELESVNDEVIVRRVLHEGLRPRFGDGCPKWVEMMGKRCMSAEPEHRPTASQLLNIIQANMSDTTTGSSTLLCANLLKGI